VEESVGRILVTLTVGLLTLSSASCAKAPRAEQTHGWNDSDLHRWVSTIGDEESRFDDLETVKSFVALQRSIEEVKQMVLHDAESELEAIEGLRMILKHLAGSTNDSINTDFMNPLMAKHDPRIRDIGAYNPDAEYDLAFIDGRYDYKLVGSVGTVPYISITVNGSKAGKLGEIVAYLSDTQIREHVDANGQFVLWLTKEKPAQPGAWVELPDTANGVVIRQYVSDRKQDVLASFAIHAVGEQLPEIETISDEEMALRLSKVADYLIVSSTWHRTLLPEMRKRPNVFVSSSATSIGASAANADNYYQMAHYQIGVDEVLLIDFNPPDTAYWNLTSATIWHESHRYLTNPVSMTSSEVTQQADGSVRFVLAREDPGHPNWIQTFGHDRGFLILRMPGVTNHPLPRVKRVSIAEIP